MPTTLGLDDDLDPVEVVVFIEQMFDVSISDAEVERLSTVGELYDLLLHKMPPDARDRGCASAMAFYRLRAALRRLGYGARLDPSSDLSLLARGRARSNLRLLEAESGLRLPPARISATGVIVAIAAMIVTWAGALLLSHSQTLTLVDVFAGMGIAWAVLALADPGRLRRDCRSLGGLARAAARLNYGRLIRVGARHGEEDIWRHLVTALSSFAAVPEATIARDTMFLQSQLKQSRPA